MDLWAIVDDIVYNNSPVDYLKNMPYDHPYIHLYNLKKICDLRR